MGLKEIWKELIGGTKQARYVTNFTGKATSIPKTPKPVTTMWEPATPEPKYICENYGMLIETGHKHTRDECQEYQEDMTTPDLRAHRTILPGRNDPKIRLPYYYDSLRPSKINEEGITN